MKKILLFLIGSVLFFGCANEVDNPVENSSFKSETFLIDDTYPEIDSIALDIMAKFQICTLTDTVLTLPPCSAKYFRVFEYQEKNDLKDGFIVEMVPGLFDAPVHQIVIIQNNLGKYKIVNQYMGFLIEMRTTAMGYNDLLIGYSDPDIGVVAIRHEWKGDKYDLVDVEEINNHFVKPAMKDSINAIFLPSFAAGH
jgi:hypothetical protein